MMKRIMVTGMVVLTRGVLGCAVDAVGSSSATEGSVGADAGVPQDMFDEEPAAPQDAFDEEPAAPQDAFDEEPSTTGAVDQPIGAFQDSEAGEHIGEATSASVLGVGCRAACAIAYALGCVSVSTSCSGAATITLGGATIPCLWAIVAACGVIAPGGTQICMAQCPV